MSFTKIQKPKVKYFTCTIYSLEKVILLCMFEKMNKPLLLSTASTFVDHGGGNGKATQASRAGDELRRQVRQCILVMAMNPGSLVMAFW